MKYTLLTEAEKRQLLEHVRPGWRFFKIDPEDVVQKGLLAKGLLYKVFNGAYATRLGYGIIQILYEDADRKEAELEKRGK